MNKALTIFASIFFIFIIGSVSAISWSGGDTTTTFSGNLTNLSQMQDTNISSPADGEVLTWSSAVMQWVNSAVGSATKWIFSSSPYWSNDSTTVYFNETQLNATIDSRAGTGGNTSWNETLADTLYVNINGDVMTGDLNITHPGNHSKINLHSTGSYGTALTFNNDGAGQWSLRVPFASNDLGFYSYEDGIASFYLDSATSKGNFVRDLSVGDDFEVGDNVYINGTTWIYEGLNVSDNVTSSFFIGDGSYLTGITGGNGSWNETLADTLYAGIEWNYNQTEALSPNSTQMDFSDGNLNIKESWLTTLWDTIFGTKSTDDLTEGSTNLYRNNTFNQTLTDSLYSATGTSGNASWNETLADTLYLGIVDQRYNETQIIFDNNASWLSTYNSTYASLISGTGKAGDELYLYNDSTIMYFNETLLNATIDARDDIGSGVNYWQTDGTELYNETINNISLGTSDARIEINNDGEFTFWGG